MTPAVNRKSSLLPCTELISYAKPRSGQISWGASTPGTVQHLSGEMFKRLAGIEMVFIPYKSDVRERLLTFGATPLPGTPEELRQQIARE